MYLTHAMSHKLKEVIRNISVDCVIFGYEKSTLEVLLVKRAIRPYAGRWALPGGFIKKGERTEDAAKRVLEQMTGVADTYMEEIGIFDEIDRYPLWRVFTVGHVALISPEHYALHAGTDTREVKWFPLKEVPDLPFDHNKILAVALEKIRKRVRYQPIGFEILPEKFTLPQLQKLYEVVLDEKIDKRNFRKKILSMHLIRKLNEKDKNGVRRPANLYMFDEKKYEKLKQKGFVFEL